VRKENELVGSPIIYYEQSSSKLFICITYVQREMVTFKVKGMIQ